MSFEMHYFFRILLVAGILGILCYGCAPDPPNPPGPIGKCGHYVDYQGVATIISVSKTPDSISRSGPCYEGYEILYTLSDDIAAYCNKCGYYDNTWTFLLTNSWSPGPKYIEKYALNVGAKFDCTLSVEDGCGPCTPCMVELVGVDPSDYFECE